jgi:hypothetical protein
LLTLCRRSTYSCLGHPDSPNPLAISRSSGARQVRSAATACFTDAKGRNSAIFGKVKHDFGFFFYLVASHRVVCCRPGARRVQPCRRRRRLPRAEKGRKVHASAKTAYSSKATPPPSGRAASTSPHQSREHPMVFSIRKASTPSADPGHLRLGTGRRKSGSTNPTRRLRGMARRPRPTSSCRPRCSRRPCSEAPWA